MAYLLEYEIRGIPLVKINTLEELAKRKDIDIYVRENSALEIFADHSDTELASDVKSHLKIYQWLADIRSELIRGLRNGSMAYVNPRLSLILYLTDFSELEAIGDNEPKLTDVVHVSEETGGQEPYFLFINASAERWVLTSMNDM